MKTFEGGVKYRLIRQNEKFPVDIVGYNVMAVNTDLKKENYPYLKFNDRLSYLTQALISRRFTDKLSLQLTPSFVHKNLYEPRNEDKNQFLTGLGGRYKISKRVSVNAEYFVNFDNHSFYKNPLSLGLDIETGGHVFQLLFTNSQINSDIGYLTNASGNWGKDIFSLGLIFIEFFNMKKLTSLLSLSSMIILCSCDSRTYEDISDNKPIELPVKYTADIKPIIENNCIGCHAEGSFIKPWQLMNR
jgi:hypothetical protein